MSDYPKLLTQLLDAPDIGVRIKVNVTQSALRKGLAKALATHNANQQLLEDMGFPAKFCNDKIKVSALGNFTYKLELAGDTNKFQFELLGDEDGEA